MTSGSTSPREVFIGLDVGTQGARAVACTASGQVMARAARRFEMKDKAQAPTPPGWSEQNPPKWWRAARDCLKEVVDRLRQAGLDASCVAALSLDSTSGTILLVDKGGEALGTALMYNDSRTTKESERANAAAGPFLDEIGYRFQPGFGLPKILWLAQHRTEELRRAAFIAHPADYLAYKLGVEPGVTDTSNVLKTGFDLIRNNWPGFITEELRVPAGKLPRVVKSGTVIGEVSAEAAEQTGLPVCTKLVAGATDGTAGFLSSGATQVGDWNSTLGTTLVLRGISRAVTKDPLGRLYCHSHPEGHWLPGAASNVGGECLAHLFKSDELAVLDRSVARFIPNRMLVYPLVRQGERFPFVKPSARGFVLGDPGSDAEKYAAYLEAVALVERWAFEVVRELGVPADGQVFASGGSIQSEAWLQLRADVLGQPLHVSSNAESAFGSAVLAAAGVKFGSVTEAIRQMVRIDRAFEPRGEHAAYFEDKCRRLRAACRQRGYLQE